MADRTINVAGNFKQPVDITNSLQNGYGCVADRYSHAEGFETSATGDYSYAGGYHADAHHNYSYVWSGINDNNGRFESQGDGTYSIYVKNDGENVLDKVYVNTESLKNRIDTTFGPSFSNASLRASANIWTGTNAFNANVTFDTNSTATFNGTAKFANNVSFGGQKTTALTVTDATIDNRVATLQYVNSLLQSSINFVSSNYVKRGGSSVAIGSDTQPVYIDDDGNAVAMSSNVVIRGDSIKEGDNNRFVYMNGGSITPSTEDIGNDGKTIVYLKNGTFTTSSISVGADNEGKTITYLKSGTITKSTATVGSPTVPVFLDNGVVTSFTRNIGGPTQPIYLKGGSIALCNSYSGGTTQGLTGLLLTTTGDYKDPKGTIGATGNNFIKTLTGYVDGNGTVVIKGTTDRPTIPNVEGLEDKHERFTTSLTNISSSLTNISSSCSCLAASLEFYAPKFNVKVSGTGNVISSVAFENSFASINLQKNITALTEASVSGTGTVLTSLAISGSTVQGKLGYPPISITRTPTSGNAVASIGYSNGTITEYRTNISSGTTASEFAISANSTCSNKVIELRAAAGSTTVDNIDYSLRYNKGIIFLSGCLCIHNRDTTTTGSSWSDGVDIEIYLGETQIAEYHANGANNGTRPLSISLTIPYIKSGVYSDDKINFKITYSNAKTYFVSKGAGKDMNKIYLMDYNIV
jgi:hypothetical protein